MILVFGGTTEGKKTAYLLDWLRESYIYSTRNSVKYKVGGEQISGELTSQKASALCIEREVKLIIDAAHPFAINVHQNIKQVSQHLNIPTLRFNRVFQSYEHEKLVTLFPSYDKMVQEINNNESYQNILALTGVQTINNFKSLWNSKKIYFRILDTQLSREKALQTGVNMERVLPEDPKADAANLIETCKQLKTQLLLSKESGESGFMDAKLQVAKQFNIPLWIVKRPQPPEYNYEVSSEKELLQTIYKLKKDVLKEDNELQSGFTTGVCVTACVKACFIALQTESFPKEIVVILEDNVQAYFKVFDTRRDKKEASCMVIKNSGDDPDVTHAEEIGCKIMLNNSKQIKFHAGEGVGTVTLPGLQVSVGEPAINPGPRNLIISQLSQLQKEYDTNWGIEVTPFVPKGKELAKQTFNPRIGVVGGISILGTTGVLKPFSSEAYVNSIKQYVSVAVNNNCARIILTPGKRSENFVKQIYPNEHEQAYLHIGNFIGEALKIVSETEVKEVVLGIMLGKAIKLAEGNLDTHSSKVVFNKDFACKIAEINGCTPEKIQAIRETKLANELWDVMPLKKEESFYKSIISKTEYFCQRVVSNKLSVKVVLFTPKGEYLIR